MEMPITSVSISLLTTLLVLTSSSFVCADWRNATRRTIGSVVPLPKEIQFPNGIDYLELKPINFNLQVFDSSLKGCKVVSRAIERYMSKGLLFDDVKPSPKDDPDFWNRNRLGLLNSLRITGPKGNGSSSFKCESYPHEDMDESYELEVRVGSRDNLDASAQLSAPTNWGLIRGLETFSQLIFNTGTGKPGLFAINPVLIRDEPRFKHRGLMLDTARHHISRENILNLLDAMAYNKLNVFHWHIVDDQSFPYESYTYPQLSKLGAFRDGLVYSQEDVRGIIEYAKDRGIRVLPELDTPGHSYTLRHIKNLLTTCYDSRTGEPNGDFGPIDPTKVDTYEIVAKLLKEFSTVFQYETMFHAGGDEVEYECWRSNPYVSSWMETHNMKGNFTQLSNYYIGRLYDLVKKNKKTMVVWQEIFDDGANPPKDVVVHVWKGGNNPSIYLAEMQRVVEAGYKALMSSCWYLDHIDYGQDWIKYYKCDPAGEEDIPDDKVHLVLGGEICMWTEYVDDTNVVSRVWPRASAAAERLWSPKEVKDEKTFLHRLEQHRCRLLNRGIRAQPANGAGYC